MVALAPVAVMATDETVARARQAHTPTVEVRDWEGTAWKWTRNHAAW